MNEIRQTLKNVTFRTGKKVLGLYRTYLRRARPYNEDSYWDEEFYETIHCDRDTISRRVADLTVAYHYASLETAICLTLSRMRKTRVHSLLDIGSGSGHWIDFFRGVFPDIQRIDACDISEKSCEFLRRRFRDDPRVAVHNCSAEQFPQQESYDLVCLMGCAFHMVRDGQMSKLLDRIAASLDFDGGILLNDLLPWISYANQFDRKGRAFKYVRSKHRWRRLAAVSNLRASFVRNYAWIRAPGGIPEGHIVWLYAGTESGSERERADSRAEQAAIAVGSKAPWSEKCDDACVT